MGRTQDYPNNNPYILHHVVQIRILGKTHFWNKENTLKYLLYLFIYTSGPKSGIIV